MKAEKERDAIQDTIDGVKGTFIDLIDQRLMMKNELQRTEERLKRLEEDN